MKGKRISAALAAVALVGVGLAGAAPATAATRCSTVYYNTSQGGGSVTCYPDSVNYAFRITAKCNAVAPYPSWTKYFGWNTVGKYGVGQTFYWTSAQWPSCPWPATETVTIAYQG